MARRQSLSCGGTAKIKDLAAQSMQNRMFTVCKAMHIGQQPRPIPVAACVGFRLTGDAPNA